MLTIKHKHKLKQNYFIDRSKNTARMRFNESNLGTDDEMARAIVTDDEIHDDKWILDEHPDGERLAAFWAKVRNEVRQDPSWNFADEPED